MTHRCLTHSAILDLIKWKHPLEGKLPAALKAITALSSCHDCWQPFASVGKQLEGHPYHTSNPLAALFHTLATGRTQRISHHKALVDVRKPLGLYRLLLEEIASLLPTLKPHDGQKFFLLFEVITHDIASPAVAFHDLRACQHAYESVFYERLGHRTYSAEKHRDAAYHLRRGSGSPNPYATFLACQGECLHARGQHDEALVYVQQALDRVTDDPAQRAELLVFLASMRLEHPKLKDDECHHIQRSWEHLLEAEHLAERHAPYFLVPILRQLLLVEVILAEAVDGAMSLLFRCLCSHHMHRQGLSDEGRLQAGLEEEDDFIALCLACAGGHEVEGNAWEQAAAQWAASSETRDLAGGLQAQLTTLLERYPESHLARAFVIPLTQSLQMLQPAA